MTGCWTRPAWSRAEDQEDLLDACLALSRARPLAGRRVGIITASGGAGIWAADACEGQGLTVPVLSAATQDRLRGLMPPYGVAANPVDLTAQGISGGNVVPALEILAASGEVDAVLVDGHAGRPGPAPPGGRRARPRPPPRSACRC